jgi:hypothetical protein
MTKNIMISKYEAFLYKKGFSLWDKRFFVTRFVTPQYDNLVVAINTRRMEWYHYPHEDFPSNRTGREAGHGLGSLATFILKVEEYGKYNEFMVGPYYDVVDSSR